MCFTVYIIPSNTVKEEVERRRKLPVYIGSGTGGQEVAAPAPHTVRSGKVLSPPHFRSSDMIN